MHPDLAPHLHTEECNKLIQALHDCHRNVSIEVVILLTNKIVFFFFLFDSDFQFRQHNFSKFWGECNSINSLMLKCLKGERQARRDRNYLKAKEHQAEVRKRIRNDPNDYTEFFK